MAAITCTDGQKTREVDDDDTARSLTTSPARGTLEGSPFLPASRPAIALADSKERQHAKVVMF